MSGIQVCVTDQDGIFHIQKSIRKFFLGTGPDF